MDFPNAHLRGRAVTLSGSGCARTPALGDCPRYRHVQMLGAFAVCRCVLSHCSPAPLSAAPWTVNRQAPLSMGFSRQEYWTGLPCPPPGAEPQSLTFLSLADGFLTINAIWEAPPSQQVFLNALCVFQGHYFTLNLLATIVFRSQFRFLGLQTDVDRCNVAIIQSWR